MAETWWFCAAFFRGRVQLPSLMPSSKIMTKTLPNHQREWLRKE